MDGAILLVVEAEDDSQADAISDILEIEDAHSVSA